MKKIVISVLFVLASFYFTTAQTTPAKTTTKTPAKTTQTTPKKDNAVKKSTGVKKDGTPDMRMKANKDSAKKAQAAGPLKKDGTPDMRYKANKKK